MTWPFRTHTQRVNSGTLASARGAGGEQNIDHFSDARSLSPALPSSQGGERVASVVHLATAGVLFALSATLFGAIWYGVYTASNGAQTAAQTLGDKMQEQQMLSSAMRLLDLTKKERAELQTLPIPQGGGADFIGGIEGLGKTAGVDATISNVGVVPPHGSAPGSFTVTVRISGSFSSCERFIRLVETLPQGVVLSSLNLGLETGAAGAAGASAGTWSGSFDLAAVSFETP